MTTRRRGLPRGWYPDSARECSGEIDSFLSGFNPPEGTWRGGVAPHAGWYFSGRAAARVIKTLAAGSQPDRVVLYGGHLSAGSDPIAYPEDSWETPLGTVEMDSSLTSEIVAAGEAVAARSSFSDNTVEILLPFVKRFFPEARVVAIHSPASGAAVRLGEAVSGLMSKKGLNAVYVGSADLTHYGPNYGFAPKGSGMAAVEWVKEHNDLSLIEKAVSMDAKALLDDAREKNNTCSAGPIASVMASVALQGVKSGRLLEYYTSYDVMPGSSFVGYAAIVY